MLNTPATPQITFTNLIQQGMGTREELKLSVRIKDTKPWRINLRLIGISVRFEHNGSNHLVVCLERKKPEVL